MRYNPLLNIFLFIFCGGFFIGMYRFVWGMNPLILVGHSEIRLAAIFLVSGLCHEIFHGLGFRIFGRVPWNSLKFGVDRWPYLDLYASCTAPLTVKACRCATVFPGISLGLLPALLGIIFGITFLTLWGAVNVALSSGDLVLLWYTRYEQPNHIVKFSRC